MFIFFSSLSKGNLKTTRPESTLEIFQGNKQIEFYYSFTYYQKERNRRVVLPRGNSPLKEGRNKQRRHIKLRDGNAQRTSITRETFGWQLLYRDENGTTRMNSHTWHDERESCGIHGYVGFGQMAHYGDKERP